MKKNRLTFLLSLLLIASLLLSGCGSSAKTESAASYDMAAPAEAPAAMYAAEEAYEPEAEYGAYNGIAASGATVSGKAENTAEKSASAGQMKAEKIIYSAYAEIETTDYDKTVKGVYDMVERFGGFMQSTSISGNNYYRSSRGLVNLRSASFTLRIPCEHFNELTNSLSELGNVPYCNTSSENVTAQYYDVQSRMDAYKTQETRLMEMLAIAETVEDMLAIQQQLTEVQYEIDSLQSRLTNYDRQVSYSTVNLTVTEVEEYTEPQVVVLSYWEKMAQGFRRSMKNVGDFFKDALLWFVSSLPALVTWALFITLAVVLFRRWRARRDPENRGRLRNRLAERKAKKNGDTAAEPAEEKTEE